MNEKYIFCIVGMSGSGKSTYLKKLIKFFNEKYPEYNIGELKYNTTRSKRYPEEDDYNFVDYKEFVNKILPNQYNQIIEYRRYQKFDEEVYYYTTMADIEDNNHDILLCSASINQVLAFDKKFDNVYVIDVQVNVKERLQRLLDRANNDNDCYEMCRRTIEEIEEYSLLDDYLKDKVLRIDNNSPNMINDRQKKVFKSVVIDRNIEIIADYILSHIER